MKNVTRFIGVLSLLFGIICGLGAAGKATYYECIESSKEVLFTEVDFIDRDAGELLPEGEDSTYILKDNEKYVLVLNSKSVKWILGLDFSTRYPQVFKIVTYEFRATCPPAGSPGPRR